jgi:hypothetical protein
MPNFPPKMPEAKPQSMQIASIQPADGLIAGISILTFS